MWIIPAAGGVGERRVGDLLCHSARWSPDGHRIACATGTRIVVLNTDGAANIRWDLFQFQLPPYYGPQMASACGGDFST